jgi:hypothetical protein
VKNSPSIGFSFLVNTPMKFKYNRRYTVNAIDFVDVPAYSINTYYSLSRFELI